MTNTTGARPLTERSQRVPLGPYMTALRVLVPKRQTEVWDILDRDGGTLGRIEWYGSWRQYVFAPEINAAPIFNGGCLKEIVAFLADRMKARRTELVR